MCQIGKLEKTILIKIDYYEGGMMKLDRAGEHIWKRCSAYLVIPQIVFKKFAQTIWETLTHTYTLYTHTHTRDSINKGASPSGLWWWWWSAAYFGKSAEQMVPHDPSPVCWMPTSLQPTNITCLVRIQETTEMKQSASCRNTNTISSSNQNNHSDGILAICDDHR